MDALRAVIDPNTQSDLVTSKTIKNLKIDEDEVSFEIVLGCPAKSQFDTLRKAAIAAIRGIPGVKNVSVNVRSDIVAHAVQRGVKLLPNVKNIIAVASGKGGVGKSTLSTNLAVALGRQGFRPGLVDADQHRLEAIAIERRQHVHLATEPRERGRVVHARQLHEVFLRRRRFVAVRRRAASRAARRPMTGAAHAASCGRY